MDWKEVLKNSGFRIYDKCNCHGAYTEKYTDVEKKWKVYAKPNRRLMELYKFENFKGSDFLYNIEKVLIKHGIIIQNTEQGT